MSDETTQLIRRAQAGDNDAFGGLFEQYKNLVYRTAFLMLDDPHEAEDALQEVFVLLHRALAGFDPRRAALSTWLYRITINHCLNQRRGRRPVYVPLDEVTAAGEFPGARLAEREAVWQAVRALSDKQRAIVILRYTWELSYAELSQVLEIPLGTVKSRLDLALKTLRRVLEEQDTGIVSLPEVEVKNEL
jgi:RNA polymerase sigma-70 factor (ECF subfamily)